MLELPPPTEAQVSIIKKTYKEKLGIELPSGVAFEVASLSAELDVFLNAPIDDPLTAGSIEELRRIYEQDYHKPLDEVEAGDVGRGLRAVVKWQEEIRLSRAIRAILIEHKPFEPSKEDEEKVATLFDTAFRIRLRPEHLRRALNAIVHTYWLEEGFDGRIGDCLDSLIRYYDKKPRQKNIGNLQHEHEAVREMVEELGGLLQRSNYA